MREALLASSRGLRLMTTVTRATTAHRLPETQSAPERAAEEEGRANEQDRERREEPARQRRSRREVGQAAARHLPNARARPEHVVDLAAGASVRVGHGAKS